MTFDQILFLSVQALVFAAWAFLAYQVLFRLRRRAADETGRMFPGVGQFLAQAGHWLRAPEDRRDRMALLALTVLLLALSGTSALVMAGA